MKTILAAVSATFHRSSVVTVTGRALGIIVAAQVALGCASHPPTLTEDDDRPAEMRSEVSEGAEEASNATTVSEYGGGPVSGREVSRLEGPPNGEWKVDDQGREFFAVEVERDPRYTILPEGRVMLPPGAAYDLAEVRDDTLVVKIYNRESLGPGDPRFRSRPRDSRLADLKAAEFESVDRLRFVPLGAGLPRRGQWRQGFEIVDMNGDGHLDLVHGPPRKGDGVPKIFLGDGAGGFSLWESARFEGEDLDYGDVAVADFNGDGVLDVAFAVHLRGLVVMVGDGAGKFEAWGEDLPYWTPGRGEEPPPFSSRTLEAVDWDGDGRPDLLALGEGPRVVREPGAKVPGINRGDRGPILFLNRGGGRWEQYDQGTGRTRIFGDGLALGDFDGDGIEDFAVASRVSGASRIVKLGREDGGWEDIALPDLVRPGIYGAVHSADLDSDGRDELVAGYAVSGDGSTRWSGVDLLEYEEGEWRRTPVVAAEGDHNGVTAIASGDLDGDGRQDLVALTGRGDRWVLLAEPGGTFVRDLGEELAPRAPGCQGYAAWIGRLATGERPLVIMGFAGESGSEKLIPTMETQCASGGGLEAWQVAPSD